MAPGRSALPLTEDTPIHSLRGPHSYLFIRDIQVDDEDTDNGDTDDDCHYSVNDHAVHVGCIFFHHESRYNPKPPAAKVGEFKATPKTPVIIRETDTSKEEVGQGVLTRFLFSSDRRLAIGATATDASIIVLYTGVFGCGYITEYCDAYTIEGKQFQGIDILDWNEVSIKSSYRRDESTPVEEV
ncbi:hypothetical protein J4E91_009099 [Alternaria rosae]|nr:hypothetical protein J4E91_009099 [Alternaria rosae]